ncbi:MAG: PC4/YdbC family ssDNA-binding protein, partial [Candidatus Gracilibacteria bacterium]|nr:PC4/YdbC family ssDNA-binding protein [Candidatus Gracilibacteria bacterium]
PDQLEELKQIISDIPKDYEIKEYGIVGKYKLYISTYNGNNSFQIREWVETETYTGYGKKGVSISMNKFDEFKLALSNVLDMFEKHMSGNLQLEEKKVVNEDEIESYF